MSASCNTGMDELCSVGHIIRTVQDCLKKKDISYAKHIYEQIHNKGMETHPEIGNHIVSLFVECGSLCYAQKVFDQLVHRNVYTWTQLMLGCIQVGEPRNALNVYTKMQADNVRPSRHTFVVLLKACTHLQDWQQGQAFHAEVVQKGIEQDLFIGGTLIDMYAKYGLLCEAQELFDRLGVQDVIAWNTLLGGYTEHGQGHKALECFEDVQSKGVSPSIVTFCCVLKACGSVGAINKGQELYNKIIMQGLEGDLSVSSSLIDMYAKCSFLIDARGVLNSLCIRNIVVWNALIAGYADCGCDQEVMRCADQMQLEGLAPDVVTLMCLLKACNNMEAVNRGQEAHIEITKKGFETHAFVGSTLLDMYAKFGLYIEAWEVLKKLAVRSVVSWNVLISRYGEHEHTQDVFKCFQLMQCEGVSPTTLTFVGMLKACCTIGAVCKGQKIHTEIVKRGFKGDITIGNTLIDMYGKCFALLEAQKVFDAKPNFTIVTWNILISCYAEHGLCYEALNIFERMQMKCIQQDVITFASVLKAYSQMATLDQGYQIHNEIIKRGFDNDCLVSTMLVDLYAKGGSVCEAQGVFDKVLDKSTASYNALIGGFAEHGLREEAWKGFKQMQSRGLFQTAITYICALKACRSIVDVDKGQEVFVEIIRKGYDRDPFVSGALVDMYVKSGLLKEAQQCVDLDQTVAAWNSLISGYVEHGLSKEAQICYEHMQSRGVAQDAVTFVSVLRAYGALKVLDNGQDVHIAIMLKGFDRDQTVGSSLIDMYAKCGSFIEAKRVLETLPAQNAVSWNAFITGLLECGFSKEVRTCYEQMQVQGISPNAVTYLCMLKACVTEMGAINHGWRLHADTVCKGFELDPYVASTLVDMYVKCGSIVEAQNVFDKLPIQTNISWNAMIKGYALNHATETALEIYENMCNQGHTPNAVTFACLLAACSRAKMVVVGQQLFVMMRDKYGVLLTVDHLTCMVDLLARSGQLNEAEKYLRSIPSSPSKEMQTALLSACITYQEIH